MDWVHCNNCYSQPSPDKKTIIFSLTSCGHIFCSSCTSNKDKYCFVCKCSCNLITLSNNLPQDVMVYFTNPSSLLDKFVTQFQRVVQFQHKHRTNQLKHHLQEIQFKAESRQKDMSLLEKENEAFKSELETLGTGIPMNTTPSPSLPIKEPFPSSKPAPTNNTPSTSSLLPLRRPPPPSSMTSVNKKRMMSGSPHVSPSPSSSSSSQLRTPNSVQGTFITQERLCVRTPPINGRMGVIPGAVQRSNSLPRTTLLSTPISRSGGGSSAVSNRMGPPSCSPIVGRKIPTPQSSSNQFRPLPQTRLSRPPHPSLPPYPAFTPSRRTYRSPLASPMINNIKL